ncbi:efflux RND transporter periplasmic adaptor subunit [Rugamonas aquatica]|uniref:Efflux RND transporter periplasmic adaptor subunit n=1 Tax=Rugamonas aquatica TaxID=2743357 RepID=A0A6A7N7T5_9BURK|nr:efflux RND transporter periplasmic adaptor subunit [Rugamonas aquatica]MQA40968.1 efflux RND transporter periplasmic adaptor subunit [Rugamonas aquatica]
MMNIDPRLQRPLLLSLLCAALSGCGHPSETGTAPASAVVRKGAALSVPAASPLRQSLQLATVEEHDVARTIPVPAVVEADPAHLVRVVPPVSGRIGQLLKHLGDTVKAGDALFTMDSADVAAAYSDNGKAQAGLTLARHNLERQKELRAADISARKDLEQAESDYAQALSESERSKARLSQLGAGAGNGRLYTLRSPLSGHVIELNGGQGGFWNDTNAPVMVVADLSTVWLSASVQEKDLSAVFAGQTADIELNAYPGEHIAGKVGYVSEVLDADTRTVKVRVAVDNRNGRLKPGMFARVTFSAAPHRGVVVPASALVQNGTQTQVYVETAAWTFEARTVTTGIHSGDQVEIATGLKAGARIVAKEGVLLND